MLQAVKAPAHRFRLGRVGWSLASLAALDLAVGDHRADRREPLPARARWRSCEVMVREAKAGELWGNIAATLARVAFSFVVGSIHW